MAPMIFPVGGIISITLLSMMGVSFCALMAIFLILAAKYSYRKLCPVRVAISAHGGEEVSLLVRFSKGAAYTIWGHINDRNPFILWSREKVKTEEEVKILVADYTGDDFNSGSWGMRVYDHMHIPVLFEKGKTDWIQIKVRVARGGYEKEVSTFTNSVQKNQENMRSRRRSDCNMELGNQLPIGQNFGVQNVAQVPSRPVCGPDGALELVSRDAFLGHAHLDTHMR